MMKTDPKPATTPIKRDVLSTWPNSYHLPIIVNILYITTAYNVISDSNLLEMFENGHLHFSCLVDAILEMLYLV